MAFEARRWRPVTSDSDDDDGNGGIPTTEARELI